MEMKPCVRRDLLNRIGWVERVGKGRRKMAGSLAQFIERLRADDELKQRVVAAERVAAETIQRDTDAITQIAAEAGYDITGWRSRPDLTQPKPTDEELASDACCVLLTCCNIVTSTNFEEVQRRVSF